MSGRRTAMLVTVIVVVVTTGALTWWRFGPGEDTRLEEALATLPEETEIVSFTDWAAVRSALGSDATGGSSDQVKQAVLDEAYERDFSAVSLLALSDADVEAAYGLSVLDTEWEVYGQSAAGAVEVLRMSEGFDFDALGSRLTEMSYSEPDGAGVRRGGADLVASVGAGLTPQLAHVALLPDEGLIVTSDAAGYAAKTARVAAGDEDPITADDRVSDMAGSLGDGDDPVAATMLVGRRTCTVAGFADADPGARAVVRQRVEQAGGVTPLDGLTMSLALDGSLTLTMHVSSGDADADLESRQALATGEAPGQGGSFEERFSVAEASAEDAVLTMRLEPASPDVRLLSDLGRGSLLPATC
jgi:hypothetical protein